MLRSTMIYLSKANWARNVVTNWEFAWRAASRFVAGETLEEAIAAVQGLNQKGIYATLGHLGEHTTNPDEACSATQDILKLLDGIQISGVQSNISLKLTQIGMGLDEDLAGENLRTIVSHAGRYGIFVRIDMEDATCVDPTLNLYRRLRQDYGLDNVGVVIQAYLYRSEEDIRRIMAEGGKVRLCKGAYQESADIAYPDKSDVDASYDRLTAQLIDGSLANGSPRASEDGKAPAIPALATHDPLRIEFAKDYAGRVGLPRRALEFQMLYGIRRDLQEQAVQEGYPVRVYVPYGSQWYPYYCRRLAERPSNVWFFVSNALRN